MGNNSRIQYRANERFPLCSTSKVMAVAGILKQSKKESHLMQQKIFFTKKIAVTTFAHSIGNNTFRLDHFEPELNTAPGDLHDTTTPNAMNTSLQKLALGDTLAPAQREQLQTWLKSNTTGNARIRAGVSQGWLVGDKTGTGIMATQRIYG